MLSCHFGGACKSRKKKHSETGVLIENRGGTGDFASNYLSKFFVPARKKKIGEVGKTESTLLHIKNCQSCCIPEQVCVFFSYNDLGLLLLLQVHSPTFFP